VYRSRVAESSIIQNEREARMLRAELADVDRALSSEQYFEPIIAGLPLEVVSAFRKALAVAREELLSGLADYEAAKVGDFERLARRAGKDNGLTLILARIARGYSQKDLARRLGLKEQQVQRYEADRYQSISRQNFERIAAVLGVEFVPTYSQPNIPWWNRTWDSAKILDVAQIRKIISHAKKYQWFEQADAASPDEESYSYLQRYIADHVNNYGKPVLLRTGLNVDDLRDDALLLAWKARVTRLAEQAERQVEFKPLEIGWLLDLVKLSPLDDGPLRARQLLFDHGIVVIVEPQIAGLKLDGAAFLVDSNPVIGLTLRRDTIDNFWYTLLHELGHIYLHYRTGLRHGFFDEVDAPSVEDVEQEANEFASNLLIPAEKWRRSPARIAKSAEVIEKAARSFAVHPAIVFGRVQRERGDYATFANKIGRKHVRKLLLPEE
jgi:HTH-type transcriptional regulator/antitoxin HigA